MSEQSKSKKASAVAPVVAQYAMWVEGEKECECEGKCGCGHTEDDE